MALMASNDNGRGAVGAAGAAGAAGDAITEVPHTCARRTLSKCTGAGCPVVRIFSIGSVFRSWHSPSIVRLDITLWILPHRRQGVRGPCAGIGDTGIGDTGYRMIDVIIIGSLV